MKKKPITLDEHIEISEQLCPARRFLGSLMCKLSRHYTNKSKVLRLAIKAENAVDKLRCELDNCVFAENPDGKDLAKIYYGNK